MFLKHPVYVSCIWVHRGTRCTVRMMYYDVLVANNNYLHLLRASVTRVTRPGFFSRLTSPVSLTILITTGNSGLRARQKN